jgi:hypothetical protein
VGLGGEEAGGVYAGGTTSGCLSRQAESAVLAGLQTSFT